MKKYEFTGETKEVRVLFRKVILHRIKAVVAFGTVEVGEIGGWIEKEENLSHEEKAWVCGDAKVCGDAEVRGNAEVWGNARVYGDAEVYGDAKVRGNAEVWGNARVCGNAGVWGDAKVHGDAEVWGNAKVWGNAEVYGDAKVWGDAKVCGNAEVWGNAEVCGDAEVRGNAEVFSLDSMLTITPVGVGGHCATFFRTMDKTIMVRCSWFFGDLEEFKSRYVQESDCDEKQTKIIKKACKLAEKWIDLDSDDESDEDNETF